MSTTTNTELAGKTGKLSFVEKVGYGLGDAASNIYFQTFILFLMFFYTDVFGIPASAVGTMFLLSRVFDAINDPLIGAIADRMNTRWGKFRPFVFFFAVPLAVLGVIAFTTPDFEVTGKLVYAYITYNLLMVAYTLVNVPYASLMGVITPNSMERVGLSSYRFVGAFFGGLIVQGSTLFLVDYFGQGDDQAGWQAAMAVLGGIAVAFLLITFITTRERVQPPPGQKAEVRRDLTDLLHNPAWLMIAGATVFQLIFIVMRSSSVAYYFRYYVQDQQLHLFGNSYDLTTTMLVSSFMAIGTAFNILGVVLTRFIAKAFDKKKTYITCMLVSASASVLFFVLPPESIIVMFIAQILISFVWGPVSVLQWAMYTDAADYGEWKNGRRATGLLMAASLFALKLGLALGGAMTGWMLGWYGFEPNQQQTEEALTGIVLLISVIPAAAGFICASLMIFYPLNNATMNRIESDLVARRASGDQTLPEGEPMVK